MSGMTGAPGHMVCAICSRGRSTSGRSGGGAGGDSGHFFVTGARDIIQLKWKLKVLKTAESVGKVIDGIVRHGKRTVSAGIGDGEPIVSVQLLGGINRDKFRLAMIGGHATAVVVENEFGIDEITVIL